MEKFVTDLDRLLDDYENEDDASNLYHKTEICDSSGYNSLKTSSDYLAGETGMDIQQSNAAHSQLNDIQELPTPTANDSKVDENFYNNQEMQNSIQAVNNDFPTSVVAAAISSDKRKLEFPSNNLLDFNIYGESGQSQVPPKKKSRPNSLFTAPTASSPRISEETVCTSIFKTDELHCDNVPKIITTDSVDDSLSSSAKRRPQSLNIFPTEYSPQVSRIDGNLDDDATKASLTTVNLSQMEVSPVNFDEKGVNNQTFLAEPQEPESMPDQNTSNLWQGIPIDELGQKIPIWVKDNSSDFCMECKQQFTVIRRRHHCRACGRLLCGKCCSWRMQLQFSTGIFPKDRVCAICFQYLIRIDASKKHGQKSFVSSPLNSALRSTNRPKPIEVSPSSNVTDPKSCNSSTSDISENPNNPKSVIFSDGIRPGGDLLEEKKNRITTPTTFASSPQKLNFTPESTLAYPEHSLIDNENFKANLPSLISQYKKKLLTSDQNCDSKRNGESDYLTFAITQNLHVQLQIFDLPFCNCPVNHGQLQPECQCTLTECWYLASIGLETIGCEEVVIILKRNKDEEYPPFEIFYYYFQVYQRAFKNELKSDNLEMTVELFQHFNSSLRDWVGIFHVRPSFQSLDRLPLPSTPFLIGLLVHRWELPWAKILPLRLMLALGNQSRFYPCPVISDRSRSPVFGEVNQTILQAVNPVFSISSNIEQGLCDPNIIPTVPGMCIHLANQETIVRIPKHSFPIVLDILSKVPESSTLALVGCFSREADSHLVCCQNDNDGLYYSSAISIQDTERKLTGATMIIFYPCKNNVDCGTSIVEDVVLICLTFSQLVSIRNSLKTMNDLVFQCGSTTNSQNDPINLISNQNSNFNKKIIKIIWMESHQCIELMSPERQSFVAEETIQQVFLKFHIDRNEIMRSYRVPSSLQNLTIYKESNIYTELKLVWTRYHMLINKSSMTDDSFDEPTDFGLLIHDIARNFASFITNFLDILRKANLVRVGLRVMIDSDKVDWKIGCSKRPPCLMPMSDQSPIDDLDNIRNSLSSSSKLRAFKTFNSTKVYPIPEVCVECLNENFVPFLFSKIAIIHTGSLITELEYHIID